MAGKAWILAAVVGTGLVLLWGRGLLPWLLLWLPKLFYALAIAWGDVPIFIPQWWPFSYYNTRYGLQLLPAFALFVGLFCYFAIARDRSLVWRAMVVLVACAFVAGSYTSVWRNVPICLREIRANGGARYALDGRLASLLEKLPPTVTFLMYLGDHGGALQRAAIPLKRTINEGDFRIWEAALRAPAAQSDFVIASGNDPVAEAVAKHPENLELLVVVQTAGQPPIRIYQARH